MDQNAKIDRFVEAIMKESEKKRELIELETQKIINDEIAKCESQLKRESYAFMQKRSAAIREDIGREIASRQLEGRKALFGRRAEITDDIFSKAALRLSAFTQTPEYKDFLLRSAKKISELFKDGIILYVRPADTRLAEKAAESVFSDFEIKEDASIKIGGLKASDKDKKIIADDTLDVRLLSQRDWFAENSGLNVE